MELDCSRVFQDEWGACEYLIIIGTALGIGIIVGLASTKVYFEGMPYSFRLGW